MRRTDASLAALEALLGGPGAAAVKERHDDELRQRKTIWERGRKARDELQAKVERARRSLEKAVDAASAPSLGSPPSVDLGGATLAPKKTRSPRGTPPQLQSDPGISLWIKSQSPTEPKSGDRFAHALMKGSVLHEAAKDAVRETSKNRSGSSSRSLNDGQLIPRAPRFARGGDHAGTAELSSVRVLSKATRSSSAEDGAVRRPTVKRSNSAEDGAALRGKEGRQASITPRTSLGQKQESTSPQYTDPSRLSSAFARARPSEDDKVGPVVARRSSSRQRDPSLARARSSSAENDKMPRASSLSSVSSPLPLRGGAAMRRPIVPSHKRSSSAEDTHGGMVASSLSSLSSTPPLPPAPHATAASTRRRSSSADDGATCSDSSSSSRSHGSRGPSVERNGSAGWQTRSPRGTPPQLQSDPGISLWIKSQSPTEPKSGDRFAHALMKGSVLHEAAKDAVRETSKNRSGSSSRSLNDGQLIPRAPRFARGGDHAGTAELSSVRVLSKATRSSSAEDGAVRRPTVKRSNSAEDGAALRGKEGRQASITPRTSLGQKQESTSPQYTDPSRLSSAFARARPSEDDKVGPVVARRSSSRQRDPSLARARSSSAENDKMPRASSLSSVSSPLPLRGGAAMRRPIVPSHKRSSSAEDTHGGMVASSLSSLSSTPPLPPAPHATAASTRRRSSSADDGATCSDSSSSSRSHGSRGPSVERNGSAGWPGSGSSAPNARRLSQRLRSSAPKKVANKPRSRSSSLRRESPRGSSKENYKAGSKHSAEEEALDTRFIDGVRCGQRGV